VVFEQANLVSSIGL